MSAQFNYYVMKPVFELQLNAPLLEGLATIGRFDGKTPSLVCATETQQLVVHTSERHETMTQKGICATRDAVPSVRTLNFGHTPTALAVGRVQNTVHRKGVDALYFGSTGTLMAYDVDRNSEYFYKSVEDEVRAMTCGVMKIKEGPNGSVPPSSLVLIGGNCTISGFDESGEELYWTVTGDQVTALMLMPWSEQKNNTTTNITTTSTISSSCRQPMSLVAASEDFELRVFDGEVAIASITEVDKVSQLVYSGTPGRFAYLSVNGTIGVYDKTERVWRTKGKYRPVSAAFCDVDFDGVPELIVGWSNGRVEVRGDDVDKRGVLFRETYTAPVSAVLAYDYRQNGQPLPIVCTVDGTVRGLQLSSAKEGEEQQEAMRCVDTFKLDILQRERKALTAELASLEEQLSKQRKGDTDVTLPGVNTEVQYKLIPNYETKQLDVVFTVHNGHHDTIIQGCILRSEALFPNKEYTFFTVEDPSTILVCSIDCERNVQAHVGASVMIGATNAENYQIYELSFTIPKFAMCQLWVSGAAMPFLEPTGHVTLQLPEGFVFSSLGAWLKSTFNLLNVPETSRDFRVTLVDMRNSSGLAIEGHAERRELRICGQTMDICGDVVESLAERLVGDASAVCHFPVEFHELHATLQRVEELNAVRVKLCSNMADGAANVKPLLIHAEDSRLMSDITNMRRFYAQLYDLNKELIAENMKQYNNYNELKDFLKTVNAYIMKAGRLRIGQVQTRLVSECRDAVKAGDMRSLVNLIRTGQN